MEAIVAGCEVGVAVLRRRLQGQQFRRNPLDSHGVISLTTRSRSGCDRSRSIRSARANRAVVANGQRPSATTTNGSTGAASVQPVRTENNSPFSYMQVDPVLTPVLPVDDELVLPAIQRMEPVRAPHFAVAIVGIGCS